MATWDEIHPSSGFDARTGAQRPGLAWPMIGMMLCALSAGISGLVLGFLAGLAF